MRERKRERERAGRMEPGIDAQLGDIRERLMLLLLSALGEAVARLSEEVGPSAPIPRGAETAAAKPASSNQPAASRGERAKCATCGIRRPNKRSSSGICATCRRVSSRSRYNAQAPGPAADEREESEPVMDATVPAPVPFLTRGAPLRKCAGCLCRTLDIRTGICRVCTVEPVGELPVKKLEPGVSEGAYEIYPGIGY